MSSCFSAQASNISLLCLQPSYKAGCTYRQVLCPRWKSPHILIFSFIMLDNVCTHFLLFSASVETTFIHSGYLSPNYISVVLKTEYSDSHDLFRLFIYLLIFMFTYPWGESFLVIFSSLYIIIIITIIIIIIIKAKRGRSSTCWLTPHMTTARTKQSPGTESGSPWVARTQLDEPSPTACHSTHQ